MHLAGYPETIVTCHGKCRAAQTCPALCQAPGPPAALAAGQSGSLTTWRCDRFGNRITSAAREVPFLASGSGPGLLRTQIIKEGDGSLEVRWLIHASVIVLVTPQHDVMASKKWTQCIAVSHSAAAWRGKLHFPHCWSCR